MTITRPTIAKKHKYVFNRMPQTDDELWWFVYALWGVKIPRTAVCPDHVAPFQAFADAFFARYPTTIWKASRGFGGKTFQLSLLCNTEAVALGAQATILGGSGAQSLMVKRASDKVWDDNPRAPKHVLVKRTTFDTNFTNGAWIRSLTASQTSVRGPHPQRLRLDEIDEMELAILEAAQGQPMRDRGIDTQTVMSSTHQYPDATMTKMLKRAEEKGWPVYQWCYRETANPIDGWLTMDEVARQKQSISAAMWETEYDLQEPSFAGRAIDTSCVEAAFSTKLGTRNGDGPYEFSPPPLPAPPGQVYGHNPYVTGVDWAKERDWTVVATYRIDGPQWELVAWQRYQRVPWPETVERACEQWHRWGGRLVHDATGVGNVVNDLIVGPKRYIKGVVMSGGTWRQQFFNDWVAAIENNLVIHPRIEAMYDEHRYVTEEDLYGKGHPPDSVVASAMAWSLHTKKVVVVQPVSITKDSAWTDGREPGEPVEGYDRKSPGRPNGPARRHGVPADMGGDWVV